ncbi:GNAT family protein [Nocardioides bigeumensis]|uniref:GNAT family protein n=1 Tax=Nocardioides bigeumensis TaxID=433657 RepID=A0ABN2XQH1_9ACTN
MTRTPASEGPVRLRPVRIEDWPTIHEWARRLDVTQYQLWGPNRAMETRTFVVDAIAAATERPQRRHVLSAVRGNRVVGLVEITILEQQPRGAELGYAVHPHLWRQGVGTSIALQAMDLAFGSLGVQRLQATCDTLNTASVRLLHRVGMHLDGTLTRHQRLGDRWRDTHLFSLLVEEWSARHVAQPA